MANLQHKEMVPFARMSLAQRKSLIPAPRWMPNCRKKLARRGSRRGMGRRGFLRFFQSPMATTPIDTSKVQVAWHQQPDNTIRARAAQIVHKVKSFFGRMIGS